MKKLVLTAAIILGFTMGSFAQGYMYYDYKGGGLFYRGKIGQYGYDRNSAYWDPFFLPEHGGNFNGDADFGLDPEEDPNDPEAPLGGGALLLVGFGAAYAMTKRKKEN